MGRKRNSALIEKVRELYHKGLSYADIASATGQAIVKVKNIIYLYCEMTRRKQQRVQHSYTDCVGIETGLRNLIERLGKGEYIIINTKDDLI
jgi:cyanate lyase